MSSPITLSASGLCRNFAGRAAVSGVSLELRRGEVLGLLGPNGAGKSTTMKMLTGNLSPQSGRVSICGIDLWQNPRQAKTMLGYLPEIPPLYRDFNVDEYLAFAAKLHRVKDVGEAVMRAKADCGLDDRGRSLIGSLSRGFQQRVGIAQAIVHRPEVIVLDEPTVGLDPNQIREIRRLIRELGKRHSVIFSTHILSEAESVCDRVEILHRGVQVFSGELSALSRECALEVGLRAPPSLPELAAVAGVLAAEELSPGLFRLTHSAEVDLAAALVPLAAEKDWGLQKIAPVKTSLEEIFSELTAANEPKP